MNTDKTAPWYRLLDSNAIASPALLIDADRVGQNIQTAIGLVGDAARLRPHVKTHKMVAVTRLCLEAGISRFKCATLTEADMLARTGAPDVLLAYPVVGPNVDRLRGLTRTYPATRFSGLIDHPVAAKALSDAFADAPLDVYIDLNVGMDRSGIRPAQAGELTAACAQLPGLRIVGIHAYDGHIRDTDVTIRQQRADEAYGLAETTRQQLEAQLHRPLTIVMGGSPSFSVHAPRDAPRFEASPGTFVFWDVGYARQVPDVPFAVAAVLLTRVISVVDAHTLTLDLGHKAVAAENPLPRVVFPDQPDARPISQSEEHLVVNVADSRAHQPGDVWYAFPIHICPTVALYDSVQVIRHNAPTERWPVDARGRA